MIYKPSPVYYKFIIHKIYVNFYDEYPLTKFPDPKTKEK